MEGVEAGGPVRRPLKQMHLRDKGPEWEGPKVRTGSQKTDAQRSQAELRRNEVCFHVGNGGVCVELENVYIHCLTQIATLQLGGFSFVRIWVDVVICVLRCSQGSGKPGL